MEDDEPDQLDPVELAQRQEEQERLKEQQQQTRPLLQKQKELSETNRPVLVDDDKELSRLLTVCKIIVLKESYLRSTFFSCCYLNVYISLLSSVRVIQVLKEVHQKFYEAYDHRKSASQTYDEPDVTVYFQIIILSSILFCIMSQ